MFISSFAAVGRTLHTQQIDPACVELPSAHPLRATLPCRYSWMRAAPDAAAPAAAAGGAGVDKGPVCT
eukprot:gene18459-4742_t